MTPQRWRRIEELYNAARERAPAARAAFLADACGTDSELRSEVVSLLTQGPSREGMLDHPPIRLPHDACELRAGSQLGPYLIETLIGKGGMGEVWKARDTRLNRTVAIKTSNSAFSGRFQKEALAIAALNHPNICTLYDVGPNYLVMEFIEGQTLAERIRQGRIPLDEALGIAKQVADAIEAAHEKAIVHRDLKPANIKIRPDGSVKVLDFGLAKGGEPQEAAPDSPTMMASTEAGIILGTAGYMSPEQARGLAVDKRADIWAFGVVLYEMLAARRLFDGVTVTDSLAAILNREPDLTVVPEKTRRLLARCLEKDPKKRLRWIGDWVELLEEGEGKRAQTLPAQTRFNRTGWIAAAVLAVVAAGFGFVAWRAPQSPAFRRLTFYRGTVSSARFAPDGRTVVYAAPRNGQPLELFTVLPGNPESRPLGFHSTGLLAISPGGEMAVSVDCRFQNSFITTGILATVPLNGGAPKQLRENIAYADWSPDGMQLALTTADSPRRLEYPPGHVLFTASGTGWPGDVRISPKGDQIAFVTMADKERLILHVPGALMLYDIGRNGRVLLGRTDDRDSVEFLGPGEQTSRDLSWLDWATLDDLSDDGQTVAFEESGYGVAPEEDVPYVRKTDGSPPVRIGPKWRGQALSPDGKWLFGVQEQDPNESGFMLLPIGPGTPARVETGLQLLNKAACFRDSKRVVFAANQKGAQASNHVQEIVGSPRPVTPEGEQFVAFSSDTNEVLAKGPRGFALYPVEAGSARPVPSLGPQDNVAGGRAVYLHVRPEPSRILRLDLASGRREFWKEIHPSDPAGMRRLSTIRITPDGKSIAFGVQRTISELYLVEGLK